MEKLKKKVLQAAKTEFSEKGFANSTLESVAARAGLDHCILRALYVDKSQLFKTVLQEMVEPMLAVVTLAVEKIEDPREFIRKSLTLADEWLSANPEYVQLIQRCLLEKSCDFQAIYECKVFPSDYFERLREMIGNKQLRCSDIIQLDLLFDSLILYPHMVRPYVEKLCPDKSLELCSTRRVDSIMDLLENGLFQTDSSGLREIIQPISRN
jgi:AcrR family transcriptional regulator